ncbi:hypothetical protein [Dinoroseobacter sp. S124A]|uniref:hypothetical protein n=1 Tax=Dinoroseobacter sp. S124A TaxID=3415128 RepID=UPI003C7B0385
MADISLAMQRFLWLIYRIFGLACLAGAVHLTIIALQLDGLLIPRRDQIPVYLLCLALAAGALFLLPSTTPYRIARIRSGFGGVTAILVLLAMSVVLVMSFAAALEIPATTPLSDHASLARDLVLVFALAGCMAIAWLGLTATRGQAKRVPILEATARNQARASAQRRA